MVVVKSTSTLPPPQTFFSASQLKNGKLCSLWGGFEEKKVNEGISVQTTDQAPFKDEAYENYWGERLESTRRLRLAEEKKRSNGRRRVPARGRGRGRCAN